MIKKIVIRFVFLLLILAGLEIVYRFSFYEKDLREKSAEIVDLRNTRNQTEIYYFGESSNVTYHPEDSIQNSISELTSFFYPGKKLTNINKYATHGGIYRHWLKELEEKKPQALIITLNLRSFGANWIHSDLETALQESLVMGKPYPAIINRFLLSLQAFDNKTIEQREKDMLEVWSKKQLVLPFDFKYKTVREWDDAMANGGYVTADGTWDMPKIVLACHYIKAYAFNIDENNARVKDFDAIAQWCEKKQIALYLNLMAENVQYADSLVGKELVFLMRQNRDFLVKRYHKNNCKVVDNLEAVNGRDFIDQDWTSEHYRYRGRMRIARNLADTMRSQFFEEYKKVY